MEEHDYWMSFYVSLIVLIAAIAEFVLADVVTERIYPATTDAIIGRLGADLRGCDGRIRQSVERLCGSLRGCDRTKVSGTFHLLLDVYSDEGEHTEPALVQVTEYSGRLGGHRWRFTPVTKGIIGRCVRSEQKEYVNFRSSAEYASRMVSEFGFTKSEVKQHTQSARSYIAYPALSEGKLVGVVYLFSTETQVFPLAVRDTDLEAAAIEIVSYLQGARIV